MIMIHPCISDYISNSLGTAVTSRLFSSHADCSSTKLYSAGSALTTCSGGFPPIAATPMIYCIYSTNTVCSCYVSIVWVTFRNVQASGTLFSYFMCFFSRIFFLCSNIFIFEYDAVPQIAVVRTMSSTSCSSTIHSIPAECSQSLQYFVPVQFG